MIAIIIVLLSWFCFRMLFGGSRTHWTDEQEAAEWRKDRLP